MIEGGERKTRFRDWPIMGIEDNPDLVGAAWWRGDLSWLRNGKVWFCHGDETPTICPEGPDHKGWPLWREKGYEET